MCSGQLDGGYVHAAFHATLIAHRKRACFEKCQTSGYAVCMCSIPAKKMALIEGARVRVTVLLKKGERSAEAPEPLEGFIRFYPVDRFRGAVMELNKNTGNMPVTLFAPLAGPHFLRWDERGIVIGGWERNIVDRKVDEYRQAWLVTIIGERPLREVVTAVRG